MKPPLFIRPVTADARRPLEADRRTADACRVRRAHIGLARAQQLSPKPMAQLVGCAVQTVRTVRHAFHTRGMAGLEKPSPRPKTVAPVLAAAHCDGLQPLLPQSPRPYDTAHGGMDAGPGGGGVLCAGRDGASAE